MFRLTCPTKPFADALRLVGPAVPSRPVRPVLSCVGLNSDALRLSVHATDGEIWVFAIVPDGDVDGWCLVPADRLAGILREAAGDVRIEADGKAVTVTTTTARYKLPAEAEADTWPAADVPDGDPTLTVDGSALAAALGRVTFAAAKDEGKYATRAVLWEAAGKGLTLVATDGKRLAVAELAAEGGAKAACLVPPKAMQVLEGVCAGPVRVWLPKGAGLAHFVSDTGGVSTRLVEGRFAPYRDVIPKAFGAEASFAVGEFHAATRQARLMADVESSRIDYAFGNGKVVLTAQGATTGEAKVELAVEYGGPPLGISFDPAYVCDLLKALPATERVRLRLVDGQRSAVFECGGDYRHLIVPLV